MICFIKKQMLDFPDGVMMIYYYGAIGNQLSLSTRHGMHKYFRFLDCTVLVFCWCVFSPPSDTILLHFLSVQFSSDVLLGWSVGLVPLSFVVPQTKL